MVYILLILILILILILVSIQPVNSINTETFEVSNDVSRLKSSTVDYVAQMDIYVINLKNRVVKRKRMQQQFNEQGLNGNFFEAINGKTLNRTDLNNKNVINDHLSLNGILGRKLRKGEIGCSLSHLTIWQNFLKNSQKPYLLIFEDDAVLSKNFKAELNQILADLKDTKWDALYLNENCYRHFGRRCLGTFINNQVIQPQNVGYGCYGYLITRSFIEKCLPSAYPIIMPVDNYIIHRSQVDYNLTVLRLYHPIVEVDRNFASDTIGIK